MAYIPSTQSSYGSQATGKFFGGVQDLARGQYLPGQDYWSQIGANVQNPYADYTSNINSLVQGAGNPYAQTPWGTSGQGGSMWGGTHVAKPGDPEVQDYMSHVLGGQRDMLADYVKQAAGAGITRGGMNVAGGPALDAALHQQAIGNLASGYGNRFREAMDYNKYLKGSEYSQYQDMLNAYNQLLARQQSAITAQAGWDQDLYNRMGAEYQGNWQREFERGSRDDQARAASDAYMAEQVAKAQQQAYQQDMASNFFGSNQGQSYTNLPGWMSNMGYWDAMNKLPRMSVG